MRPTFFSLSVPALSFGFFCTLLPGQRPNLSYGGNWGTAGPNTKIAYLGHPDQAHTLVEAGTKRKGALAVLLYSLKLLPKGIPFGPDFLDIDPGGLFLTVPGLLDSQGKWKSGFPVPAQVPNGIKFAVQAMVWAKGEAAPLRFSRGKLVRIMDSAKGDLYIDGDAISKGNGSPYLPFQTIIEGISLAGKQGKGILHIQPSTKVYGGPIQINQTKISLLGENWLLKAGLKNSRPTLVGTVQINGSTTSPLLDLRLAHLRILLPPTSLKGMAKCLYVSYAKNILVEDSLFEGTTGGKANGVRGIVFGRFVQGTISNCTIRDLNVGSKTPKTNVAAYGIVLGRAIQVTVKNCWIHDLLSKPPSSRTTYYYIAGISAGQNQPESAQNRITIANNVLGPLRIKAPLGTQGITDGDLYGVILSFGTQGSIRNKVFHGLDFSALTSNTQFVTGFRLYETGKSLECTNNIFWDFRLGKVTGIKSIEAMDAVLTNKPYSYTASYSCIWQVKKVFLGKISGSKVILKSDPLLLPPLYLLKPGSPCLGTGNPLYPPKNMGIFGGSFAGKAGKQG